MFCLRIYDFLKFCAVHLSEPVLEPNRTGRTGSKLFCSGSGSVLANELRFWFSVLKKWSENRTEPNFGNTIPHNLPANGARCLRKDSRHIVPNHISLSILNQERLIFSAVSLTMILFHLVKRPSLVCLVIFGNFISI